MEANTAQIKAINHKDGPSLVLAGPGSGKTTVITRRIQRLIETGVPAEKILVITFTRAAALEMKQRFVKLTGVKHGVTFGTFHAVFFGILKNSYGYTADDILRDDEAADIITDAIRLCKANPSDIAGFVENAVNEIGRFVSTGTDMSDFLPIGMENSDFEIIYKYYLSRKKERHKLDFDDMCLLTKELFKQNEGILKIWQNTYEYILVDEFQDINRLQYDVVRMLAGEKKNIFVVGDDDQSIYGFRGASPQLMLYFAKDFPGTKTYRLNVNYRSTSTIVRAAGKVIKNNEERFKKDIESTGEKGDRLEIVEFENVDEEYFRIIQKISADKDLLSDTAIIFRTNAAGKGLVRKLIEANIPFNMKDKGFDLFNHWIAKDILAYINLSVGKKTRKDMLRIMNRPKRYISREYLTDERVDFDRLLHCYSDRHWILNNIKKLRSDLETMELMPPFAMVNYIRQVIGYDDFLKEYAQKHSIDFEELFEIVSEISESAKKYSNLDEWLDFIDEYHAILRNKPAEERQNRGVNLLTMHGSKGLEFDTVYIIDANNGITPHNKAILETDIEEERRMFYVAMTRAKKHLNIYFAKERYNKVLNPSIFVLEIMSES